MVAFSSLLFSFFSPSFLPVVPFSSLRLLSSQLLYVSFHLRGVVVMGVGMVMVMGGGDGCGGGDCDGW